LPIRLPGVGLIGQNRLRAAEFEPAESFNSATLRASRWSPRWCRSATSNSPRAAATGRTARVVSGL